MPKHDWYSDTGPKALEVFLALHRAMSPSQKARSVFRQNRFIRGLAEANERKLHPQADDREIFLRVVARRLDRDTMKRVYGWPPDESA
jgi:hypothetical protein